MQGLVKIAVLFAIMVIPVISIGETTNLIMREMQYKPSLSSTERYDTIQLATSSIIKRGSGKWIGGEASSRRIYNKRYNSGEYKKNDDINHRLKRGQKVLQTKSREPYTPQKKKKSSHRYRIKYGDTLQKIAKREGVKVKELLSWNHIKNKHMIFSGNTLIIHKDMPGKKVSKTLVYPDNNSTHSHRVIERKTSQTKKEKEELRNRPSRFKRERKHIVQSGETLSMIAKMYNTTVNKILANNSNIYNRNLIFPGMRLKISTSNGYSTPKRRSTGRINMSLQDKITIFKKISKETGVSWRILYGLCKKESYLGEDMIGDGGKAIGWFQIHKGFHPHVSYKTAMDLEGSTRYAANFLIKLGYFKNQFNALRKYNGSLNNPITGRRAKQVLRYAEEV